MQKEYLPLLLRPTTPSVCTRIYNTTMILLILIVMLLLVIFNQLRASN